MQDLVSSDWASFSDADLPCLAPPSFMQEEERPLLAGSLFFMSARRSFFRLPRRAFFKVFPPLDR